MISTVFWLFLPFFTSQLFPGYECQRYSHGYSNSASKNSPGYSYTSSDGYRPAYAMPAKYDQMYLIPYTTPKPNPVATEWPYAGGMNSYPISTVPSTACKSTTYRTNLNCPCKLVGQKCSPANSVCIAVSGSSEGLCSCTSGYVVYNNTCVTTIFYNSTVLPATFGLLQPTLTASCFLPANSVVGNIAQVGGNGTVVYTLTLLSSSPTNISTPYITVESPSGNLLFLKAPQLSVVSSQTYSAVGKDVSGIISNVITFTIQYHCTAPICSFDLGNSFMVDCTRFGVADTIVTGLASNSVSPTTFAFSLVSSTGMLGNTYYTIDSTTGQIFLKKEPHGGIFAEVYSMTATNGVGQTCSPIQVTFTTTANCF